MPELERRILQLFDELQQASVDLHAFFDLVGGNTPSAQREVLAAVERLVEQGWLEERGNDFYARSEGGRQALRSQEPAAGKLEEQ